MSKHRDHVELLLGMAVANHERDGYLAPTLIMSGPRDALIMLMAGSQDLAPAFAQVAGVMATVRRDTTIVVTIVEAWMKAYKTEEEIDAEYLQHGDLARMEEAGDATVYTALVVQGTDTKDPAEDITATYYADGPQRAETTWVEGVDASWGRMPEMMRHSLDVARTTIVPPFMDTDATLKALAEFGLIEGALEPLFWEES